MKNKYLPFGTKLGSKYPILRKLFIGEGCEYFFAKRENKFYVISDFGSLAEFLEEDELDKVMREYEFIDKYECIHFIKKRYEDVNG